MMGLMGTYLAAAMKNIWKARQYGYAHLSRAGLGNQLFSWARCELYCRNNSIPMIAPQWLQPKIGPFLRKERYKRIYYGMFNQDGYITGLRRIYLLYRTAILAEGQDSGGATDQGRSIIIKFSGLGNYYQDIINEHVYIKRRLECITRPAHKEIPAELNSPHIAVHVRRGDITRLPYGQPPPPQARNGGLDDRWYIKAIQDIRDAAGWSIPVVYYSDGWPEELKTLLSLPDTTLAHKASAIADIWRMSRASLIVGTPGSTFSGWAAYLGATPSIWMPLCFRFDLAASGLHTEIFTDYHGQLSDASKQGIERWLNSK